jgi:hypothetical protein
LTPFQFNSRLPATQFGVSRIPLAAEISHLVGAHRTTALKYKRNAFIGRLRREIVIFHARMCVTSTSPLNHGSDRRVCLSILRLSCSLDATVVGIVTSHAETPALCAVAIPSNATPVKMKLMPVRVPTAHTAVDGKPNHKSKPTITPAIPLAIIHPRPA